MRTADAPASAAPTTVTGTSTLVSRIADLLALLLGALYLVLLWRQASGAILASDECFHAHVAEWIALHGRLPRELPEFYSGLPYFYPPLLHLLAAPVVKLLGLDALMYFNVALTGLLLALIVAMPGDSLPRPARLWAMLLCVANTMLSRYAVRFYAETLATLLAVLVTLLLLRLRARPSLRGGIVLGVGVGAALLAKQPAVLIPGLLAVLAAIYALRRERTLAVALGAALVTALVIALPFFVRNAMLFHSPFYPPIATDAQRALDTMNTGLFSLRPSLFYRNALLVLGPVLAWLAAVALLWNLVRARFDLTTGLLAACIGFILVAPFVPRFEPRHLNPITATMAVLTCIILCDHVRGTRWGALALQTLLIGYAALALAHLPRLRSGFDASHQERAAYQAIREHVPAGATVLSLRTYDTFYYSGRAATWPIPWGNTAGQLELFAERDPERFAATLDRLGLEYLLVRRSPPPPRFNGGNYPESFVACVIDLIPSGRLRVVWQTPEYALVARVR